MSFSSTGGLSFKYVGEGNQTAKDPSQSKSLRFDDADDDGKSCCFNKCVKRPLCGGYLLCGTFKTKFDTLTCFFITVLITALISAAVVPVAFNSFINSSINSLVVIDSTSAPSYDAWRTNVNSDINIGYGNSFLCVFVTC